MAMQRAARGRPSAPTSIVDEILPIDAVLQENWRLLNLGFSILQPMSALQWLAKRRLIKNNVYCENCNTQFGLNAYQDAEDGYRWKCKGCNKRKSVRDGSFFSESRLSLQTLITYIYGWSQNMPQNMIQHEAAMRDAPNTLADWANFCRDVCEVDLETNPSVIGGINADGTPIIVEIDEPKFFNRKYHRGQWRPGHWVFGGIERESRKCFLVEVPDRTAVTLQNCILQFILPGSHIVSDGWASYAGIENLHNGIYSHAVVIHERNFVDPLDNDTHTQNIEN
jgi:transposase-like protein